MKVVTAATTASATAACEFLATILCR